MRSSLVPMPPGSRLIVLRAPYLALCGGDTAPALLLDILVFYMDLRYQQDTISDLWLPFTYQQFMDESLGLLKEHDVRRGLAFLRTSGLVHSKPGALAHTLEYWVDIAMLRELLDVGDGVAALNPLPVTDQSVTGDGPSVNSALSSTRVNQPLRGSPAAETPAPFVGFPKPPPRERKAHGFRPEPTRAALDANGDEIPVKGVVQQSNLARKIALASGGKVLWAELAARLQEPFRWPTETTAALGDHVVMDLTPDELFDTPQHPHHEEFVEYLDGYIAKIKRAIRDSGKNKQAKPSMHNMTTVACEFAPFRKVPEPKIKGGTPHERTPNLSEGAALTRAQLEQLVPAEFRDAVVDV